MRKFSTNINSTTDFYILCTTFRSKFFVSQYRKILLRNTSVYRKISGSEKIYASERGEGVSRFSVENYLSHSAEKFRRGTLSCFTNFGYRKKIMNKRGEGVSKFSVENVLSHSAEKFRREPFTVALISGFEKVWIREGEYQDFPSKIFCLTVPKNFVREPFRVSLISGIEKFYASEGYVTIFDFLSKFFCLTVAKNFVGEPFVLH